MSPWIHIKVHQEFRIRVPLLDPCMQQDPCIPVCDSAHHDEDFTPRYKITMMTDEIHVSQKCFQRETYLKCKRHAGYMQDTCILREVIISVIEIHVRYMLVTCEIHMGYMRNACGIHVRKSLVRENDKMYRCHHRTPCAPHGPGSRLTQLGSLVCRGEISSVVPVWPDAFRGNIFGTKERVQCGPTHGPTAAQPQARILPSGGSGVRWGAGRAALKSRLISSKHPYV